MDKLFYPLGFCISLVVALWFKRRKKRLHEQKAKKECNERMALQSDYGEKIFQNLCESARKNKIVNPDVTREKSKDVYSIFVNVFCPSHTKLFMGDALLIAAIHLNLGIKGGEILIQTHLGSERFGLENLRYVIDKICGYVEEYRVSAA